MQKILQYKNFLIVAAICVVTFICFSYTRYNQFTCWDDDYYVTNDPYIKALTPQNLKVIFTEDITKNNYHPFCMLSLAINYYFSQLNPAAYYLTNIFIHLFNVIFVFMLLSMLCRRLSTTENARFFIASIGALWFGIHPMHVESVSWIAERKDVLYGFFYFAGLITYLKYSETLNDSTKEGTKSKTKWYWITVLLFVSSCLSKPMAVVFPLSLLCIDFLLQRKLEKKLVIEKILFFVLSLICGSMAFYTQNKTGAIAEFGRLTIAERIMYATYGFDMYVAKFFNPTYLSTFYPYPYRYIDGTLPTIYYAAPFIALALLVLPVFVAYKWFPKLFRIMGFGFGYLFCNLVFVLQFISCGAAIMADRYSYVAYAGFIFMIAWLVNEIVKNLPALKMTVIGILILFTGGLSYLCYDRTFVWHDSETLLTDAIEKYPMRALLSYKWLGNYYLQQGELDKALENYGVLTMLHAADAKICDNVGNIYMRKKKYDSAIAAFDMSLTYQNNVYKTYLDRAQAFTLIGDTANAVKDYEMAVQLNPSLAGISGSGSQNVTDAYSSQNQSQSQNQKFGGEGNELGNKNTSMPPAFARPPADTHTGNPYLDSCLMQIKSGDTLRAFRNYLMSYKLNPGTEKMLSETGFNYVQTKRFDEAIRLYDILLKLNTSNGFYFFYRGVAKFSLEKTDMAIQDWLIAVKMNSRDVQQSASYNLCVAYDMKGNYDLAVQYAEMALKVGYVVKPEYLEKLKEKQKNQQKK